MFPNKNQENGLVYTGDIDNVQFVCQVLLRHTKRVGLNALLRHWNKSKNRRELNYKRSKSLMCAFEIS